jgi:hypothetical protein
LVRSVTCDVKRNLHKTSTKCWSISYFCKQVLNILFLPGKLLSKFIPFSFLCTYFFHFRSMIKIFLHTC